MSEQELQDPMLLAVRRARPAISDAALSSTSPDAVKMLEGVLHGEDPRVSPGATAPRRVPSVGRRGDLVIRRILRPRIGAIAIAAAAAVAAAVIALGAVSGVPSLVDRAYAALNAGDQVVHEVDIQTDPHLRGYYDRTEGWLLPADGRTRLINVTGYQQARYRTVTEWIITATGDVFGRACLSGCTSNNVGSFIDGRFAWGLEGHVAAGTLGGPPATLPGTFANWFRAAYHDHAIKADGDATFGGRHAARFQSMAPSFGSTIVFWRPGTPPPLSALKESSGPEPYTLIDWYVDPATAQPIGFSASPCTGAELRSCGRAFSTTRIATFRRLDPTPQNLAQLTGPNAPRGAQ